jgi:hypothetical protein
MVHSRGRRLGRGRRAAPPAFVGCISGLGFSLAGAQLLTARLVEVNLHIHTLRLDLGETGYMADCPTSRIEDSPAKRLGHQLAVPAALFERPCCSISSALRRAQLLRKPLPLFEGPRGLQTAGGCVVAEVHPLQRTVANDDSAQSNGVHPSSSVEMFVLMPNEMLISCKRPVKTYGPLSPLGGCDAGGARRRPCLSAALAG